MTRLSILAALIRCWCFFLLCLALPAQMRAQQPTNTTQKVDAAISLNSGKPVEQTISAGQTHTYRLSLTAGQFVKVVLEYRDIIVGAMLLTPDGKPLIQAELMHSPLGPRSLLWIAEADGDYQLWVRASSSEPGSAKYNLRLEEKREVKPPDRDLLEIAKLRHRGEELKQNSKFNEAVIVQQQALEMREKLLGKEHTDVASSLTDLAEAQYGKQDRQGAESSYKRALAIREKLLGADHLSNAYLLTRLGTICSNWGEFAQAGEYYQKGLQIFDKWLGIEHTEVARVLSDIARLHGIKGEYGEAERLFQRVLSIQEKKLRTDHLDVGRTASNLGVLYSIKGDYTLAESFNLRALAIREKRLGADHPETAQSLGNLATGYRNVGDNGKAEPYARRVLAVFEKSFGQAHPSVAMAAANLAMIYRDLGDYEKAEPLFQRSLAIQERTTGIEHPDYARGVNNLGLLLSAKKDYENAATQLKRALEIREKIFGPWHRDVASTVESLGQVSWQRGDIPQAISYLTRLGELRERDLSRNLIAGSERQKLAYLSLFSKNTGLILSLHTRFGGDDPVATRLALTTLFRHKGRTLDATKDNVATLRNRATPQDDSLFAQLAEARSHLAKTSINGPGAAKPNVYKAQLKQMEEQVEKLEAEIGLRSAEFRSQSQSITFDAVQSAIPRDKTLVEFALYTPLDPQRRENASARYVAYLLTTQGQPRWADLGEAATIDRAIEAWRKALSNPKRNDVRRLARAVDEKVMQPVRALLGDTRQLLIAPDGLLNLIPFAALVDERNRFLVENYSIHYLTSGRDLLRLQVPRESKGEPVAVADPAFGIAAIKPDSAVKDERSRLSFQPLPVTADEADGIKQLLPGTTVLMQKDATEAALKRLVAPRILHIATHGFFLNDQEAPPVDARGSLTDDPLRTPDARPAKWAAQIENPLLRSGLALAGANLGKNGDDDGLLTAMEAAGLNLWGTKLVVLSACDTGVGEIKNGEGVYGLRRALVLAGAETVVMSLWPVSDVRTKDLMLSYYAALNRGEGRGEALRRVQLKMLRGKQRHPFYWAGFLQLGEWANLDGKR